MSDELFKTEYEKIANAVGAPTDATADVVLEELQEHFEYMTKDAVYHDLINLLDDNHEAIDVVKKYFDDLLIVDNQLPDGATFDFGVAVEALKQGARVARVGWNGKGMFLYYVPENKYPASRNEHGTMIGVFEDDMVPHGAYIAMKTAQNNVVPWLASQTDVLADDWVIVE